MHGYRYRNIEEIITTLMKISIIIPAYNESAFIRSVINKVESVRLGEYVTREIIIIDDGSTDDTKEMLNTYTGNSSVKIFHLKTNMGKGAAIKLGLENSSGDIILIQDADLEYDPNDYPKLIGPIASGRASIVYGSRFKGSIKNMLFINRVANIISNLTVNLLFGTRISDINTCYKAFRKSILEDIAINSNDFAFDTEMTAKLLKRGYKIEEIPINYTARSGQDGKKMNWIKALRMYFGIIKYRFR